ncbi:MAG: undecaprenyl-phosphate glucose phosphotransferase [Nitrospinota bacterium]
MLKKYGQLNVAVLLLCDLLSLSLCWLAAYYVRFYAGIVPLTRGFVPLSPYLELLPFLLLFWLFVARITGLYERVPARAREEGFVPILKAATGVALCLMALTFFYRERSYSRVMMAYFWAASPFFLWGARLIGWSIIRKLRRRGVDVRRTLLVGHGPVAERVAEALKSHAALGFHLVGALSPEGRTPGGLQRLGGYPDLRRALAEMGASDVYLALPLAEHDELEAMMVELADETADVRVVPDLLHFMRLHAGVEELAGLPVVNLSESPLFGWRRWVKRGADVVIASLLLGVLSPLMALIALAIKLTSPGPVLFRQERMGLDGVRFEMLKFRSMGVDAERETGAVWARRGDARRTSLGALLRRTSLDELPQLWNVLCGEMSLVGPRPERPVFVQQFRRSVPGYMLRHKVKSGITGWAQVNGWRGDTSLEKRIECDLYYIEHWSLLFDLEILWLTLWKGLISKHAY